MSHTVMSRDIQGRPKDKKYTARGQRLLGCAWAKLPRDHTEVVVSAVAGAGGQWPQGKWHTEVSGIEATRD